MCVWVLFCKNVAFNVMSLCAFHLNQTSFSTLRAPEVGGSGKLWGFPTRDAAAHGSSRGCDCYCLGPVAGEVNTHTITAQTQLGVPAAF